MKKLIIILLTLLVLTSCKAKESAPFYFDDGNLHSFVSINNINIEENKDTTHFDIEVEAEDGWSAIIHGEQDAVILQRFSLENGKGICSFDIDNNIWPDDTKLFFEIYKDDNNSFILTINKNNLEPLKSFTYISQYEKTQSATQGVNFIENNLNVSLFVKDLTVTNNDDSYTFHLEIESAKDMYVFVFDNPNGDTYKNDFGTIKDNDGLIEFDISKDDLNAISELEILIGDDLSNLTISINPKYVDEINHLTYGSSEFDITDIAVVETSGYNGNFALNSLTYEKQDNCYVFKICTTSDENMKVMAFDAPDAKAYKKIIGKTKGNDTFEFTIKDYQLDRIQELCIMYYIDGVGDASVNFWIEQITK